jgi:CheY-like chemotaxis protein
LEKHVEWRPLRILVVDDNPVHRLLLQEIISDLGACVHLARDGYEAVEFGGLIPFDLILMDLAMRSMNGEQATQALRSLGVECPIMAVTADRPPYYRSELTRYGFDGLIEKPFSMKTIASTLQAARSFAESRRNGLAVRPLRFDAGDERRGLSQPPNPEPCTPTPEADVSKFS